MTIARRGQGQGHANAVGLTLIEGSFFLVFDFFTNIYDLLLCT